MNLGAGTAPAWLRLAVSALGEGQREQGPEGGGRVGNWPVARVPGGTDKEQLCDLGQDGMEGRRDGGGSSQPSGGGWAYPRAPIVSGHVWSLPARGPPRVPPPPLRRLPRGAAMGKSLPLSEPWQKRGWGAAASRALVCVERGTGVLRAPAHWSHFVPGDLMCRAWVSTGPLHS